MATEAATTIRVAWTRAACWRSRLWLLGLALPASVARAGARALRGSVPPVVCPLARDPAFPTAEGAGRRVIRVEHVPAVPCTTAVIVHVEPMKTAIGSDVAGWIDPFRPHGISEGGLGVHRLPSTRSTIFVRDTNRLRPMLSTGTPSRVPRSLISHTCPGAPDHQVVLPLLRAAWRAGWDSS